MPTKDFRLPDFDAPSRPYRLIPMPPRPAATLAPAEPAPAPAAPAEGDQPAEPQSAAPGGLDGAINELKARLHRPGPPKNHADWWI